jgi:hypothetical protein
VWPPETVVHRVKAYARRRDRSGRYEKGRGDCGRPPGGPGHSRTGAYAVHPTRSAQEGGRAPAARTVRVAGPPPFGAPGQFPPPTKRPLLFCVSWAAVFF